MDFQIQKSSETVEELFSLCRSIQEQLQQQTDILKVLKKQAKAIIVQNSPNVPSTPTTSERKSTMDLSQLDKLTMFQPQIAQIRSAIRQGTVTELKKQPESTPNTENNDIMTNSNKPDITLSEKIVRNLQKLVSILEYPQTIVYKTTKNFKGDQNEYLWQTNPINEEIDEILAQIQIVKIEIENLNMIELNQLLDNLLNYYTAEKQRIKQTIEAGFLDLGIQESQDQQNLGQTIQSLFNEEEISISAPFIQHSLVKAKNFNNFINDNKDFEIQRIAVDMIQPCQKNIIIYLMNKFLLNINIQPSIVIRAKEIRDKKIYTYFLVSPKSDTLQNIDEYCYDQENQKFYQENDSVKTINIQQVIYHIFSALLTVPFESFLPNYAADSNGNLIRVFNHIKTKEAKNSHSAIRNPLFFFGDIFNMKLDEEFFQKLFQQEYLLQFFKCLTFIIEGQKTDFLLKDRNKQQSLYFTEEQYYYIFSSLQRINQTFMWIKEVILPAQGFFCISHVISRICPIINEFSQRNKSNNLKEYKEFIKKLSIEEHLQKIISKKSLIKYKDSLKYFEEGSKTLLLKNISFENIIKQWFQQLNLTQISLPKNRLYLIYFGAINYLFQNSAMNEQAFNESTWRQEESWENALQIFYGQDYFRHVSFNPSIFVELLALYFNINLKKYDVFDSIKYFEETNENFTLLERYLSHKKLLGDKFFPDKNTMFEKSLKYKKFKLAKYLISKGEGRKLNPDTLTKYLIQNNNKPYSVSHYANEITDILQELMNYHKNYVLDYQWDHVWKEIFVPASNENSSSNEDNQEIYMHIYSINYGEKKIPKYIWDQSFDYNEETKRFIFKRKEVKNKKLQTHLVGEFNLVEMGSQTQGIFLIEQANIYPGLNYMKDSLMQKILPHSRLRREYIKIQNEYYYLSHYNTSMESLSYYLTDKDHFSLSDNLDKEMLSDRILLEMILYPENSSTASFLTEQQKNSKFSLIDIGQSEILVQNIGQLNGEFQIYTKSILFCLYEMNSLIPSNIVAKYANLDAKEIIQEWLLELSKYQDDLIKISQYKFKNDLNSSQKEEYFSLYEDSSEVKQTPYFGIPIQKQAIKHVVQRFVNIIKTMKYHQKKNSTITHQELFRSIDKELASLYEAINSDSSSFLDQKYTRLMKNCAHEQTFHTANMANMIASFSEKFRGDITTIDQLLSSFRQIGPTQALEKVKKFIKIITLEETESEIQKINNVQNIKQFTFFLRNLQIKQIQSKEVEDKLIKKISEFKLEKPINYLNFSNSQSLTIKTLKQFQADRILVLILSNTKIVDNDLIYIADQFKCLVYLDVSNCDEINFIGAAKPLQYLMSSQLVFPALKTFIANNLKNVWILDLGGSHIQNIQTNDCPKLLYFFLNCPQIKKIAVKGCKALNSMIFLKRINNNILIIIYLQQKKIDELISIYILEGINVQVNSVTSEGKFEKAIKVIKGNKNNFIQGYQLSINEIYGQLNYTENISLKEIINVISQAFSKRDLQHVFPKNFVSNMIGNLFNSKKANKQINDEFFRFMFKFFIKNPHIKDIDVASIVQDKKPILFLNIILEQLSTNSIVAGQYESYSFRNLELDQEEINIIAQIISKNKREGISYIFSNCIKENQENVNEIFKSISKNKVQINKLDFVNNDLKKLQIENMRDMFLSFSGRLQQLRISHCNLDNNHLAILCEGLKSLKYLRMLDFSNNFISAKSFSNLGKCFDSFSNSFQTLILDENNLADDEFEEIVNWNYIKFLQIKQCSIGSNQLNNLSSFLNLNKCTLTHLNLSHNKLTPHSYTILQQILEKNTTLKELGLAKTMQEGTQQACLESLMKGLENNTILATLDISANKIQNEGLNLISDYLQKDLSLRQIKILEDNTFDVETIKKLIESLKVNTQIKFCEISGRINIIEFDDIQNQIRSIIDKNNRTTKSYLRRLTSQTNAPLSNHSQLDFRREGPDFCRLGLSIDGGGMRGIIPATMINVLCNETKYPVHSIFDSVGGTSIGGLIALAQTGTLDGVNPIADKDEIVKIFENHGSSIFNSSKLKAMFNVIVMDQAKYDPTGIESVLSKYFQNCKLSDVLKGTNAVITAVRREQIQGKSIAKIFRSREAVFNDEKNFFMRDVARATSAAPTFFPSAEIKNINQTKSYSLIDGGVGQNNPSKLVLEDIKKEAINGGNEENFFLLSLGTGEAKQTSQLSQNAGALNLINIIDTFGEGASAYVDSELKSNYGDKYLRIQPLIPILKKDADLDSVDPKIIEVYSKTAREQAYKFLCEESKYGPFHDRPIVEWFAENTARKKDFYI